MAKKIIGFNMQGQYQGRNLIVSHKDLDGTMSALIADRVYRDLGLDSVCYVDIASNMKMTDEMIQLGLDSLESLNLNMFENVFILDRDTCSSSMAEKLFKSGVKNIYHIDHHITNKDNSKYVESEMTNKGYNFKSIYEKEFGYSGCFLTFKTLEHLMVGANQYNLLKMYVVIADLYDTFNWTKLTGMDNKVLSKLLLEKYGVSLDDMMTYDDFIPMDRCAVNLNYIYKFLDDKLFMSTFNNSIDNSSPLMSYMKPISTRFEDNEETNLMYINYARNDAKRGVQDKYGSAMFDILTPKVDENNNVYNVTTAEVLFVGKELDFDTASVASYRFLKDNPNIILIYRTKNPSYSYSVRSIGDLSTLPLSTALKGGGHVNASGFTLDDLKTKTFDFGKELLEVAKKKVEEVCTNSVEVLEKRH